MEKGLCVMNHNTPKDYLDALSWTGSCDTCQGPAGHVILPSGLGTPDNVPVIYACCKHFAGEVHEGVVGTTMNIVDYNEFVGNSGYFE